MSGSRQTPAKLYRPSRRPRFFAGRFGRAIRAAFSEEGSSLVETALIFPVVFGLLFGAFELTMMVYSYQFVSDAAREATRYAVVRGSLSCTNTPNLSNCNLSPNSAGNPLQSYVRALGFPLSSNLTATPTWLTAKTTGSPGTTSWSSCSSGVCNLPGNAVRVKVTCAYPATFPFWRAFTFNISSTSQMVISQ